MKTFFIILALLLPFANAWGQKTIVSGQITSTETGETLPFATLIFKGTKTGTTSDLDGNYRLETYYASDSLIVQLLGYKTKKVKVRKDVAQVINIQLESAATDMPEVVITPDEGPNPAIELVKKVLRNKEANNKEKLDAYEFEAYTKVEFDLNNITDKFQEKKIFKPFDFVFEGIDTTQEKPHLPVFMTEALSNFYYRRTPIRSQKEIINATKVSGIENQSIQQFLGDMYQNVNIYDNNVVAFDKSFVSPISSFCFTFYDYDLIDSMWIDNKWCYQLQFFPKRKNEMLFFGDMWVNDSTYAIKRVIATVAEGANINWIKDLQVRQEYDEVEPEVWMLVKDELVVDFNVSDKKMGVYGRKTAMYKDFVINVPKPEGFYGGISDVVVDERAATRSDEFWEQSRHEVLSDDEKRIYSMVDSLKRIPQFKTIADMITLFVSGYRIMGPIELGPYYSFYSYNPIEGSRIRLGGRTSNSFSKKIMLDAYTAYGFKDERFKYGGGFIYMLDKNPRMAFSAHAKHDLEQLGAAEGAFSEDNILSSVFRRNPANKLTDVVELTGYFEREWLYGLSNKLIFTHRVLKSAGNNYTFVRETNDSMEPVSSIVNSEIAIYTRFAFKEKFVYGEFERLSLGTKYPELEILYSIGLPGLFGGEYEYQKIAARVKDRVRIGPLGYFDLQFAVGKVFDPLPFPLLAMHPGNETFFYDETSYNTMNYLEFSSDQWASAWATYHAEGLFLNRIPLLRRLKWREVASVKLLMGRYNLDNDKMLSRDLTSDGVPDIYTFTKPYAEAAVGIENILKILRFDVLWRLSYLDHPNVFNVGIRVKLQVDF